MRVISGNISLPDNCPSISRVNGIIEVRDVSLADAPSTVLTYKKLSSIDLKPHGLIAFSLNVPEVPSNRSLNIRVHISLSGNELVKAGDLLTTASFNIPTSGSTDQYTIPLTVV